jgi:hypothetical protein
MGLIANHNIVKYLHLLQSDSREYLRADALRKLKSKYLSMRVKEAGLIFKLHNLGKRMTRIEADEQLWTARRYYLGLWYAGMQQVLDKGLPPMGIQRLQKKMAAIGIRFANNEIKLLDLQKRKERSNGVKYVRWEMELQQVQHWLSLLEEALPYFNHGLSVGQMPLQEEPKQDSNTNMSISYDNPVPRSFVPVHGRSLVRILPEEPLSERLCFREVWPGKPYSPGASEGATP